MKQPLYRAPMLIVGFGDSEGEKGEKGELFKNYRSGFSKPLHFYGRSYRALKASNHLL